jgi:hypothetical protein
MSQPLKTAPSVQTLLRGPARQGATTSADGHASSSRPHPSPAASSPHGLAALSRRQPALVTVVAGPHNDHGPRRCAAADPSPRRRASLAIFTLLPRPPRPQTTLLSHATARTRQAGTSLISQTATGRQAGREPAHRTPERYGHDRSAAPDPSIRRVGARSLGPAPSLSVMSYIDLAHADSRPVQRTGLGDRRRAGMPVDVPDERSAAAGQIPPDLARALCGRSGRSQRQRSWISQPVAQTARLRPGPTGA